MSKLREKEIDAYTTLLMAGLVDESNIPSHLLKDVKEEKQRRTDEVLGVGECK